VFIPVSGWAADRFGTKRLFEWAVLLFTAGSLLCGIAVNLPMLVASRLVQGMGGAMMTPVGRLALVRAFPRSEMITVMNFVLIPALIGPLLGPVAGGLIVHWFHWRTIFFINLPLGLFGYWLARRTMPDFRDDETGPLDWRGFLLFGSGILLLSYVLEVLGDHSLPYVVALQLGLCAVALLGLYLVHARRIPAPILDLAIWRTRTFRISVGGGFITRLGVGGMPFLLPLLYQVGLGYAPWQAGLLTMPAAAAAIVMKIVSKPLLARYGHRRVLRVNTVVMGVLIMTFGLVGPGTPIPAILLLSFMQGLASSTQFTSMNSLVYADVSDDDASKASSIASTGQQLAWSFGVALASVVAQMFLQGVPQSDQPAFIGAMHQSFVTLGLITIVSSLTFSGLRPADGSNVSRHQYKPPMEQYGEKTA